MLQRPPRLEYARLIYSNRITQRRVGAVCLYILSVEITQTISSGVAADGAAVKSTASSDFLSVVGLTTHPVSTLSGALIPGL